MTAVKKKRAGSYDGTAGGHARAKKLTPARRKEIAQRAANARWKAKQK